MKPAPLSLLICYTTQQYSIGVRACGPGFCLQVLGGPSTSSSVLPHTCVCQHQSQGGKLLQNVCNCPAHSPSARVHRLPTIGSTEHVKKCVAWTLSAELLPKRLARPSHAGHHSSSAFNRTCRLCISRAASDIIYHIANAAHTHEGSSNHLTLPHHHAMRARFRCATCHSVVVFVSCTITRRHCR